MSVLFKPVKKLTGEVFGISNTILADSYVDRGGLDREIGLLLKRPVHIALRGESKCGKSWLRQRTIPDSITVQCRLGKSTIDIYRDALSQLDVRLEIEKTDQHAVKGRVEATGEVGFNLFAKLGLKSEIAADTSDSTKRQRVGHDVSDLRFIAQILLASEKRLVIEDFHYLAVAERRSFAFDLKALWDYGLFVVIVGVWSESNMLLYLNPDLTGRVQEISVGWKDNELKRVLEGGGKALKVEFSQKFENTAVHDCFGNVGILQALVLRTLDQLKIYEEVPSHRIVEELDVLEFATMQYAEELNPLYQQFAKRVSNGIRTRKDSTGIYAHAMAAVMDSTDEELTKGLKIDQIFERASARESRVQKGNLRTVLEKFEALQVDQDGRGLVLAYNSATGEMTIVDRQLLLYRRYATVKWPWEDLITEAHNSGTGYECS